MVALAFHVDYWDRLGWRDRFASPAHTRRQAEQQARNGARFSYTPQVVLDGRDRKDWPGLAADSLHAERPLAPVSIELVRQGERYSARVRPGPAAPARLAAFWAVTEDGHGSAVQAGENAGATLHHDQVVRAQQPVADWPAVAGREVELRFNPPPPEDARRPRSIKLVVLDAASGRPVQAVKLGC